MITSSGLEIAGNNKTGATPGASNSLMKNHQWGFAPRIGIAWAPRTKLTVRAGYGIYYDRGELFSYLSPSAGSGFNGPFGVTLAPPFVQPISIAQGATLSQPFGTTLPPPPPATGAAFLAYLPNLQQTACGFPGCWPSGNLFGSFPVWRLRHQQQTALHAELDPRPSISALQQLDLRGRICRQSRYPFGAAHSLQPTSSSPRRRMW